MEIGAKYIQMAIIVVAAYLRGGSFWPLSGAAASSRFS